MNRKWIPLLSVAIVISSLIVWFSPSSSTSNDITSSPTEVSNHNHLHQEDHDNFGIKTHDQPQPLIKTVSTKNQQLSEEEYEIQRRKDYKKLRQLLVQNHVNTKSSMNSNFSVTSNEIQQPQHGDESSSSELELLHLVNPIRDTPHNPPPGACPNFRHKVGRDADSKVSTEVIHKYSRYTSQYCNSSGMLQMHFGLRKFISFMDVMGKIVGLEEEEEQQDPNNEETKSKKKVIFDLGSGCGTLLNYFHLKYGTIGTGIDLTSDAIKHSRQHARGENQTYCHLDATLLRFFPSNHYDAIVSWAVLYHIRRTWVQCAVMKELARMLKPGAVALIAQIRTEKTQAFWKKGKCQIENCTWRRLSDAATFHEKSFKRNGFFSIYLKKNDGGGENVTTTAKVGGEVVGD